MLYSNATEYAMRGLAELASRDQSGPVLLDDLLEGTDLPRDYMAKIFQRLARGGIVRGVKGRNGGFVLARASHEISMLDVVDAMEGPHTVERCVVGMAACNDQMPCAQHDLYKPIRQRLRDYLRTTTLADLAASLKSKKAWQALRQKQVAEDRRKPVA